jgi:membrane associated rhomboid family serine protease
MALIPIKDDNPLRVIRLQLVTGAIIIANVLFFLLSGGLAGMEAQIAALTGYGVVPSELLDVARTPAPALNPVAEPLTLVTYMFFHAGWLHLLSNMAFLWVFGDNVEDAFGHPGYALFYLICGIAGAISHVAFHPGSHEPLVGASAAVSGVLAAYFLLYPRAKILVLAYVVPVRLPAWIVLGVWVLLQFSGLFSSSPEGKAIAWWAHIGGFATGLVLTLLLRRRLLVQG